MRTVPHWPVIAGSLTLLALLPLETQEGAHVGRRPNTMRHCRIHGSYEDTCPGCESAEESLQRAAAPLGDYECPYCKQQSLKRNASRCPLCREDPGHEYWADVEVRERRAHEAATRDLLARREREVTERAHESKMMILWLIGAIGFYGSPFLGMAIGINFSSVELGVGSAVFIFLAGLALIAIAG